MSVYPIDFKMMMDLAASALEVERPDSYFTDTELEQWINIGIVEMAKLTRAVHVTKFLHLSANVARYTLPTDSLRGQVNQVLYLKTGSLAGAQYPLKKLGRRGSQSVTPASMSSVAYQTPGSGSPLYYLLDGSVIEFRPIPTSATGGANRICYKAPGIPDFLNDVSAIPEMAVEHRMLPVTYAVSRGQQKDKDPREDGTYKQFLYECEQVNADVKWGDQEEPPAMLPEDYFDHAEWSIK